MSSLQENMEQTSAMVLTDTSANANNTNMMSPEDMLTQDQTPPYLQPRFLGALGSWKTIKPLDDMNWVAWKAHMTSMFCVNRVWGHCDGTAIPPPISDPNGFDE